MYSEAPQASALVEVQQYRHIFKRSDLDVLQIDMAAMKHRRRRCVQQGTRVAVADTDHVADTTANTEG